MFLNILKCCFHCDKSSKFINKIYAESIVHFSKNLHGIKFASEMVYNRVYFNLLIYILK